MSPRNTNRDRGNGGGGKPPKFDPGQRARDFRRDRRQARRARNSQHRTPEQQVVNIEQRLFATTALATVTYAATKAPERSRIEIVDALPHPAQQTDIGRMVQLRGQAGFPDTVNIGMQLPDDTITWIELSAILPVEAAAFTWVRNFASNDPYAIGLDSAGAAYVDSPADFKIKRYNATGTLLAEAGGVNTAVCAIDGSLKVGIPAGIAVGNLSGVDKVWFKDTGCIQQWGANPFSWDTRWGGGDTGANAGLWFDPALNKLWVADATNNRIIIWDLGAPILHFLGSPNPGAGNGQFSGPRHIIRHPSSGEVFVADTGNNRIQVFTYSTGPTAVTYNRQWGSLGSADGQLNAPYQMAFDGNGNLHVCDSGNDRIQVFNPATGAFVAKYGTSGTGDGQLDNPTGIAINSIASSILICDRNNDRISVWT